MIRQRRYPDWICHNCGITYCRGTAGGSATYHIDDCQCCGAEQVPCTEPRDYGYFKEWPLSKDVDPQPFPLEINDLIETLIKHFDFDKVHKALVALQWQWWDGQGPDKVPTVEQLRKKARHLLQQVTESKEFRVMGTGGLYAQKYINSEDPDDDGLELQFVLEKSEAYLGDYS